jgi:hypothetical protein
MTQQQAPQINVSKIPGGAGFAGALFALSSVIIFLIGIPILKFFLPAAIILGFAIMGVIHWVRRTFPHDTPGTPWILK